MSIENGFGNTTKKYRVKFFDLLDPSGRHEYETLLQCSIDNPEKVVIESRELFADNAGVSIRALMEWTEEIYQV